MSQILIETKYTVEDYIRSEIFIKNLQLKSSRIIKFGSRFLFVVALLELAFAGLMMAEGKFGIAFFGTCSALFLFFLIYKIIPSYSVSAELDLFKARLKTVDQNSTLFAERRILFDEEGVTETYAPGKFLTGWDAISKVVETEDDFFFYVHGIVRFQPKRDIPEDRIDLLRIMIKAHLAESADFQQMKTT